MIATLEVVLSKPNQECPPLLTAVHIGLDIGLTPLHHGACCYLMSLAMSHGMDALGCETPLPNEGGGVFTEAVESEACLLPSNLLANLPKAFPHI